MHQQAKAGGLRSTRRPRPDRLALHPRAQAGGVRP